ncbi:PQQ-dependent sugar dehydrogenase [Mucilaginibacter sp.]|uniref:PQQ-dependent sugar dehydrogenase n=1 Tax=Mucilaginibacter sp. TaxID=1882438 RepID=UPI003D127CEC
MINKAFLLATTTAAMLLSACSFKQPDPSKADNVTTSAKQQVKLAPPYATRSTRTFCDVIGWPKGKMPIAPAGFKVNLYADGLDNPRNIYLTANGDVLVSEANTEIKGIMKVGANIIGASASQDLGKSANKIILLRDINGDGIADVRSVFLSGLNHPYGMLVLKNWFYVANTDGLWRYPYHTGQTKITGKGTMILTLPAGGYNNHWTRNLRINSDSTKIYVSVGSGTNDAEKGMDIEIRRADILEIDPDGKHEHILASGLRNPAGIDVEPLTHVLFTAVNERDGLGDNLVPDYLTSVKEGGFYGWPYAYFGQHEDPDHVGERPDMVKKTITPDLALGSHTASLGLAFYTGKKFPAKYQGGAFIGQHGSWNSSKLVGYKVVFVPFVNGKPGGIIEDFLTGFIADAAKRKVYGRPVGIAVMPDGSILVADDTSNKIWRVSAL